MNTEATPSARRALFAQRVSAFPPPFTGEVSRSDAGGHCGADGPLHRFAVLLPRERGRNVQ